MKKKLILAITASAMALSLAIGGTLMLFTNNSETATNTMTIGEGLVIQLEERGDGVADYKVVGQNYGTDEVPDVFTGIPYPNLAAGQTISKEPKVTQTTGLNSYIRVAFKIVSTSVFNDDDFDEILNAPVTGIVTQAEAKGWTYEPNDANRGYFYYTDLNGDLIELAAGTSTVNIFDEVTIPNIGDAYAEAGFQIKLYAQAIQADYNNVGGTDLAGFFSQFPANFPID